MQADDTAITNAAAPTAAAPAAAPNAAAAEAAPAPAAPAPAAKPAARATGVPVPVVHTKERDPKDREQWKRERAIALSHGPKPTK